MLFPRQVQQRVGRFVRQGTDRVRHFTNELRREAPRVVRRIDQEVMRPASNAARVAGAVSRGAPELLGPAKPLVDTFVRGMQSYDALREGVLGGLAQGRAREGVVGAAPKKLPPLRLD